MARLDVELVRRGMAASRTRAQELIKSGLIYVDGEVCTRASRNAEEDTPITQVGEGLIYVGRGGLKLEHALKMQKIDLNGCVCMDIGASTGGFTDCMLQNGAAKVYAVDVGHDQLADKLRADKRVINMEGTDIRRISPDMIGRQIDFISVDVSFISLSHILPSIVRLLRRGGKAVLLIKPQFEAGKAYIGKNGIVRSKSVHMRVLENMQRDLARIGLCLSALDVSPIHGGSGNIEYLAVVRHSDDEPIRPDLKKLVGQAFLK